MKLLLITILSISGLFGLTESPEHKKTPKELEDIHSLPREWHLLQEHGNRAVIILPCDSPNDQIDINIQDENATLTVLRHGEQLNYQILSCQQRSGYNGDIRMYDLSLSDKSGSQKHVIIKNVAGQSVWYGLGHSEDTHIYTPEEHVSLYDKVEATCD